MITTNTLKYYHIMHMHITSHIHVFIKAFGRKYNDEAGWDDVFHDWMPIGQTYVNVRMTLF